MKFLSGNDWTLTVKKYKNTIYKSFNFRFHNECCEWTDSSALFLPIGFPQSKLRKSKEIPLLIKKGKTIQVINGLIVNTLGSFMIQGYLFNQEVELLRDLPAGVVLPLRRVQFLSL